MRTVLLTVDASGSVSPTNISIGHQGEHHATLLEFSLPPELTSAVGFFRLSLGDYLTEELYPENDKITCLLPQCVMLASPLFIQLEGYTKNDTGELTLIFKSEIVAAQIKHSLDPLHELSSEVKTGVDGALAKLSYYVKNGTELAENMSTMVEEGREILNDTIATVKSKADVASTLAGYGITDAYTKKEIDAALEHELTEVYGNNDEVMLEYYFQDDITFETSHYYYFEHPEPLKANTTYKLRIDSYHDHTEIQNFCVCVGDIHHPVIENIPIIFDVETYAFIESAEWVFPKISGNTDKVYFRFDCLDYRHRNHEAPYKLLTPVILPCYHKAQVDSLLEGKTNVDSVYTKSEVDSRLSDKADKANTLSGYGITDAYTKSETDNLLKVKADVDTVYTKAETDARLSNKADTPKKYFFISGDTITLADNTTYCAEGKISTLTIIYPETDFICSLEFTLASEGDITITLPESKYIGGSPTFANGETWELNIKNGVVVGGLVE